MHLQPITTTAPRQPLAPPVGVDVSGPIEMIGAAMTFTPNAEIYGENEDADYFYKVIKGTVRTYKILNDGRRQIGNFYGPGDVFGLESGALHTQSADAVDNVKLLVIKRRAVLAAASRHSAIAHQLWLLAGRELERVQSHNVLLIKSAQQRVAGFLLDMASRASGNEIDLPMTRQDIADYLGLTMETVSRTLTQLENDCAIGVPTPRRIVLRNRSALARLDA